ncbi:MAG: hypothetical protein KJO29_14955 [Bacteroidia bacterium]|nr:hypothetical protein [Bacteroidia bacterium]
MTYTYKDWTDKLKQELKTEDLSSKQVKLKNGIVFNPLLNPESQVYSENTLNMPSSFAIGHCLIGDNDHDINSALHLLLSHGLSCFRVIAAESTNLNSVLKNIHTDMVFIDIVAENADGQQRFLEYISSGDRRKHEKMSYQSQGNSSPDADSFVKVFDFTLDKLEEQKNTLQKIYNVLSDDNFNNIKLRIRVGGNLLDTLPFIRAIKRLEADFFSGEKLVLEANCNLREIKNDPTECLVSASVIAMWCRMAGADQLYFDRLNVPGDIEHARQLLNIQNLITHEVKMDSGIDPFKGAHAIESLTETLLEGIRT